MNKSLVLAMCSVTIGLLTLSSPVFAQQKTEKVCIEEWRAKKAADTTFKTTQKAFVADCRKPVVAKPAAPATAATPAPAPATKSAPAATVKPKDGTAAMRARQKACGADWKADKAAGKSGGLTWPKYWSECDKRKKAAGM